MSKLKDLIGQRFGRLTVIERKENDKSNRARWMCKCDCGNEVIVSSYNLTSGATKSCGCLSKDFPNHLKHGMYLTRFYTTWCKIKERCLHSGNNRYANYGKRGISVYPEWINNFNAFYDYVSTLEHFGEEGYTLDRIDNNGNYEPNNLRWADKKTQARNKSNNIFIKYNGKNMTLAEASEKSGINYATLRNRLKRGDNEEKLFRPVQ